ncbi:MAG: hypothetical protein JWR15_864 [Prosthecobacter sp.]|nr:hypothetical protein [Prosthecobacter sp.]
MDVGSVMVLWGGERVVLMSTERDGYFAGAA